MEVHFNEDSYTVGESEGQVSLSLRITGQFFIPVYAIIEVTDGTATGETGGTAVGDIMYYWYTCTAIHGINECLCLHYYLPMHSHRSQTLKLCTYIHIFRP